MTTAKSSASASADDKPVYVWRAPIRVVTSPGARAKMTFEDGSRCKLEPATLASLLAAGINFAGDRDVPDNVGFATLLLHGRFDFYVGEIKIPRGRALNAIARAVEHGLDLVVAETRGNPSASPAVPADADSTPAAPPANADDAPEPAPVKSEPATDPPTPELPADFDRDGPIRVDLNSWDGVTEALMDRVAAGARVEISDGDKRVAVLVSWEWYREKRERLATLEAAYWAAWIGGTFDPSDYSQRIGVASAPPEHPESPPRAEDRHDDR